MMKNRVRMKWAGIVLGGIALVVFIAAYAYHGRSAVSTTSVCYDLLAQSLETARTNGQVTVPSFVPAQLTHIRCAATPGFVQFELAGKDTAGNTFRIYELSGGRAASGADSILNYCYEQDGALLSGVRVTGRDGKHSTPVCAYDTSFVGEEVYSFDRGIF